MKRIEIYANDINAGECCCDCDCCAPTLSVSELANRFTAKYPDIGEFAIYLLGDMDIEKIIPKLNQALKNSNERLVISRLNFSYIMKKIAPIIIVDGKIVSVKDCPDEDELYSAIVTGKKIPTKPSCC